MAASEGSLERVYSPWTKVWIISFIHSHKCIRKAPENENNAYVTAEIVYLHIYKIYFGSEISKWGPSAINREFGILDCWHAIRGAPRTNFRLKLGIWPRRGGGGSDSIPTFINHCFYGIFDPFWSKILGKFTVKSWGGFTSLGLAEIYLVEIFTPGASLLHNCFSGACSLCWLTPLGWLPSSSGGWPSW